VGVDLVLFIELIFTCSPRDRFVYDNFKEKKKRDLSIGQSLTSLGAGICKYLSNLGLLLDNNTS
jgi:hypothetical protein